MGEPNRTKPESDAVVLAVREGDESAFTAVTSRYRRELHLYCYRMLASFSDAEDIVQETFLRAWRRRESFQGRSTLRAWLYAIATNGCLDFLEARSGRTLASDPGGATPPHVPWLEPYPDRLLATAARRDEEPDAVVVAKETIELAFLVAIQHLPPRQRAVLVLADVLDWSSKEMAELLELSVASVTALCNGRVPPCASTPVPAVPRPARPSIPTSSCGPCSNATWTPRSGAT